MNKEQFYEFLKKIPKAELHLHSEALISKDTVGKILSRKNPKFKDKKNVEKIFSYKDLKGFIKSFLLIQSSFEKLDDFKKLFGNILPYLKRNNIVYAELFFSPSNFIKNGIDYDGIIKVLSEEIDKIKKNGFIVKIIIDVSRTFGLENAEHNLDLVVKSKAPSVIGIGLGGDERKGPAKNFKRVFDKAHSSGYHCVAHAGEDVDSQSIWDSLKSLKAERIGHGIAAINDDKLIKHLASKQIPLEVCPTSNVFTKRYVKKIEKHPIKFFFENKVMVTLNTDDPAFFNVELIDEYWNLYSKLDFSMEDIKAVIINGFKASFLSETQKNQYIKKVNSAWKEYSSLIK